MGERILHVFLHALKETALILPFLLAIHILIEIFENKAAAKLKANKLLNGGLAPLVGSAVGLIPQCGFSVVATKLFSNKNIKLGTLLAVYIATSDEAVPILLSQGASGGLKLLPLIGIKFALALAAGYAINFFLRRKKTAEYSGEGVSAACGCHGHTIVEEEPAGKETVNIDAPKTKLSREKGLKRYLLHPLVHSLTIAAFIFAVNIVFFSVFEFVGEDNTASAMQSVFWLQPLMAIIIGLVPNCAGSVIITQCYAVGGLSLGAAVAGLSVNAGVALAVLFKENKNIKQSLFAVALLCAVSVAAGYVIQGISAAV